MSGFSSQEDYDKHEAAKVASLIVDEAALESQLNAVTIQEQSPVKRKDVTTVKFLGNGRFRREDGVVIVAKVRCNTCYGRGYTVDTQKNRTICGCCRVEKL